MKKKKRGKPSKVSVQKEFFFFFYQIKTLVLSIIRSQHIRSARSWGTFHLMRRDRRVVNTRAPISAPWTAAARFLLAGRRKKSQTRHFDLSNSIAPPPKRKKTEAGGPIPFGLLLSLTWMQGRLSTWFRRKKERKNKCTLYCYRAQRERSCGVYEEDAALPLAWGTRAHPERRPDDPPHSAHNAMPSCLPVRKKIARGFLFFLFFLSAKSSATTGTLGARQHGLSIVSWSSFYRLTAAIENLGNGIFTRDAGWFKCGSESHHLF